MVPMGQSSVYNRLQNEFAESTVCLSSHETSYPRRILICRIVFQGVRPFSVSVNSQMVDDPIYVVKQQSQVFSDIGVQQL
jgi:hypothetical protein